MSRSTRLTLLAPAALLALALAGCGSSEPSAGGAGAGSTASATQTESGSPSPASAGLAITVKGDAVTPKNQRIKVTLGQPLKVTVTSDREGELHVHSSPEQTFDFKAGTSTTTFTFKTPGVVELEEHGSDTLIAQLEVR